MTDTNRVYETMCMTCDKTNHSWKCNQVRCRYCGESTLDFRGATTKEDESYYRVACIADETAERGY